MPFFERRSELKLLQSKEYQIPILNTLLIFSLEKNWGQEPFSNCFKSLIIINDLNFTWRQQKFLKGQYYLGTVICSVVRKKPWFKVLFVDGQKLSFPYPVSRQIKIISECLHNTILCLMRAKFVNAFKIHDKCTFIKKLRVKK